MSNNITLKEMPYNWEEEEAICHCDVGGSRLFEIIVDGYTIGHVYIEQNELMPTGQLVPCYINWIEFLSIFHSRHLLRPVIHELYRMFGELWLEASDKNAPKYAKIGCINKGVDELTENVIFMYSEDADEK